MNDWWKIKKETLVFLLVVFPFFSDQFQGFLTLQLKIASPFSVLIKTGMIIFMTGYLIYYNKVIKLFLFLFLFFILLISLLTNTQNLQYFIKDFSYIMKLVYFPLSFFFFLTVWENKHLKDQTFYLINKFLFIMLSLALAASIVGIGMSQYGVNASGVSLGYSGYFNAGNELGPLALIFYTSVLFHQLKNHFKFKVIFITFIVGFFICLLIATKVTLLGIILVTLITPFVMGFNKNLITIKKYSLKYYSLILLGGTIAGTLIALIFWDMILAVYGRMAYYFSKSTDIGQFLATGRDIKAAEGMKVFREDYSLLQQLFGGGYGYYQRQIASQLSGREFESIEVDFYDTLLSNGIIGLMIVFAFWLTPLILLTRKALVTKDTDSSLGILLLVLILGVSFTGGHMFASSLVGFYLAFVISFTLFKPKAHEQDLNI